MPCGPRGMTGNAVGRKTLDRRQIQALFFRAILRDLITGIGMAHDARARIVPEYTADTFGGFRRSVGHDDLAGMEGVSHADTAAMMEGDPGGAGGGVEERVQQGPVGNGIGAVHHAFGFAIGAGDGA